ncbi:helix-turn-helix transcriptional regulator [Rubellimicrobium sp. CFH 75288]|uniref:ArsR/SmtB family transcription factor n=1 Tax=Rubellimicrobium sp. CFH 75288 TaxID=2697034 RepID=UPI0014124B14|nr:metalloregulator ArsR/SmtB family transcription factor [Rubellimicrobium sp. CFH 75288]NAZ35367.1 metalloregulator ArsR/SmtB family transcription factor [Rubellimicrobium sp. CFH 75288]
MPHQQELDALFRALSDPTRRAVLVRLARGPARATDLAALAPPMALPSFLQHLRRLEESGLIRTEKRGRERLCSLRPGALAPAHAWLAAQQALWEDRTDRLEAYLATPPEDPDP